MFEPIQIQGLFKGKSKLLPNNQESAIQKVAANDIKITYSHIIDDEVVDLKHHGGDMRVVHHYTEVNYAHLKKTFPEIADRFKPGTFGENLYTHELTEKDLCIGDIFKIGEVKLQLTVPRRPCATINQSYEDKRILKEVMSSGHVGWFYKVITEGTISTSDKLEFIERPYPELPITKLYDQGLSLIHI